MDYTPFIGKPFQVISKLQARYTGIFDHIDQAAQTICLAEVYNHGTENRQSPHFLPGTDQCLGWVKFHTDSIHAISIPENYVSPAKPQAPQDPILASVSQNRPVAAQAPAPPAQARAPPAPAVQGWVQDQAQQKPATPSVPPIESPAASSSGPARQAAQPQAAPAPTGAAALPPKPQASYPPPSARRPSKTEAIDRVQQSISDLSIRGSRQPMHATPPAVPDAEFDFASANAKFKKASAPPPIPGSVGPVNEDSDSESEATEASPVKPAAKLPAQKPSYNKSSFFDNISTDSSRVSRADERHRNLDTFGEAVPASALNGPQAGRGGYGYGGRGRGGRGGGSGGHRGGPRPSY